MDSKNIKDSLTGNRDIAGSLNGRRKTCIALPEKVLTYLRLKSASTGKPMQDLILEAVQGYFGEGVAS